MKTGRPKLQLPKNLVKPAEKKPPTPPEVKALKKLENIKINSDAYSRRQGQIEKARPLVHAYFSEKLIFQETVSVEGVQCLRPLIIGASKVVFQQLQAQIEDLTNTALRQLIDEFFQTHCAKPQYLDGLLRLKERFDLDGNSAQAIAEKDKVRAVRKVQKLRA